ncbi:MAG TPA: TraY domain-containing protein [Tichowtungia sp.]|nr:TraY domain-containing protein [Tichowtungia sp.]
MLAIRLNEETEERLARLAKRTGRTKTFYAREAILEHLEDMEDAYTALHRMQHPQPTVSSKEVKRELGL